MINWKTAIAISLFLIAGIEFLSLKDHYHAGKLASGMLMNEVVFGLTVLLGIFLMFKGLTSKDTAN